MKKKIIYSLILLAALILQTSAVPVFFSRGFAPDLVLMLVLAWTIRDGFAGFLPWIIFAGLAYDALAYAPMGTHVLVLTLSAYLVSFFSRLFLVQIRGIGVFLLLIFVFLAMVLSRAALLWVESSSVAGLFGRILESMSGNALMMRELAFNAAFVFFGLWLIKHVKKYFFIT